MFERGLDEGFRRSSLAISADCLDFSPFMNCSTQMAGLRSTRCIFILEGIARWRPRWVTKVKCHLLCVVSIKSQLFFSLSLSLSHTHTLFLALKSLQLPLLCEVHHLSSSTLKKQFKHVHNPHITSTSKLTMYTSTLKPTLLSTLLLATTALSQNADNAPTTITFNAATSAGGFATPAAAATTDDYYGDDGSAYPSDLAALTSDPYTAFEAAITSIDAQDTAAATAVDNWEATETAVPTGDLYSLFDNYDAAYQSGGSAAIPDVVTAFPSSLQEYATSQLREDASAIVTAYLPVQSSVEAAMSSFGASASASGSGSIVSTSSVSSSASEKSKSTATSMATSSKPASTASTSTSSSASSASKASQTGSGAGRNEVLRAAGVVGMGLAGGMALLWEGRCGKLMRRG